MRNCRKNQRKITYSLYGASDTTDAWGNKVKTYGEKIETRMNVSPSNGVTSADVFGASLDYDKAMTTHDMTCAIDEYSKVWIDNDQYKVVKVARSLNNIRYAIKRVEAPKEVVRRI